MTELSPAYFRNITTRIGIMYIMIEGDAVTLRMRLLRPPVMRLNFEDPEQRIQFAHFLSHYIDERKRDFCDVRKETSRFGNPGFQEYLRVEFETHPLWSESWEDLRSGLDRI